MHQLPLRLPESPNPIAPIPADRAVLDTQVVLDWLVFRDPGTQAIARAIKDESLRWLASPPMLDEIERVLERGVGAAMRRDRNSIRTICLRLVLLADVAAASTLRCADPDDQMFIDLALAASARWLFTRDKALLRLAPRARDQGVLVLRPADWQPLPRSKGGEREKKPPEGGL